MNTAQVNQCGQVPLGIKLTFLKVRGVDSLRFGQAVKSAKSDAEKRIKSLAGEIRANLKGYELFFAENGHTCPLTSQFERTIVGGLPAILPAIDLLLAVEMSFGVLAGIQDFAKIHGTIKLEIASENERFEGMRSQIKCRVGEVVIRDHVGIIASMFQGPDNRTKLSPAATDFLVVLFAVPQTPPSSIQAARDVFQRILEPCSKSFSMEIQTL